LGQLGGDVVLLPVVMEKSDRKQAGILLNPSSHSRHLWGPGGVTFFPGLDIALKWELGYLLIYLFIYF
jgi:hypothetical protein